MNSRSIFDQRPINDQRTRVLPVEGARRPGASWLSTVAGVLVALAFLVVLEVAMLL